MNREQWLTSLARQIWANFYAGDERLTPPDRIHVSTGWPSRAAFAKGLRRKFAELWHPANNAGIAQLFISPAVADPAQIAALLYVELLAAGLPPKTKRGRKEWQAVAATHGLTGAAQLWSPVPEVEQRLAVRARALGPYPHDPLDKADTERTKASNRQRKLYCTGHQDKKVIYRASAQVIAFGLPDCPVCEAPLEVEKEEPGEGNHE